jgi:hypothetical protein
MIITSIVIRLLLSTCSCSDRLSTYDPDHPGVKYLNTYLKSNESIPSADLLGIKEKLDNNSRA